MIFGGNEVMRVSFKKSLIIGAFGLTTTNLGIAVIKQNSVKAETEKEIESIVTTQTPIGENATMGPGYYDISRARSAFSSRAATDTAGFINTVAPGAISGWNKYGILPSVSIAQGILESGWGKSQLATTGNNLFGIKGVYQGQSVWMPTQEYVNNSWITVTAQFRKYPSWAASIEDHGLFLASNPRYSNLWGVTDYQKVTSLLQSDGYATAPTYASTLNSIISQYNLTQYDQQAFNSSIASLDNFKTSGTTLSINGWHAIDAAANLPYSFIILTDATTGQVYKQIPITRSRRADVQNVYPYVTNSLNSGFSTSIPVSSDMYGHSYKVTSRYAQNSDGSGTTVDAAFTNTITIATPKQENKASLDKFTAENNLINMSGWHASNQISDFNYHYLIVMDANTNTELTRTRVTNSARPDVAASYPDIINSGNSGFNSSIEISRNLIGRRIYVISRYSKDIGANSNYIDYWFKNQTITVPKRNDNKASLDHFSVNGTSVQTYGWHATDLSEGRDKYHFILVMNAETDKEIRRIQVNNSVRNDVAAKYPNIYNVANSGFNTNISIDRKLYGKSIYLISRYSSDNSGDSNYVDYRFSSQTLDIPNRNDNKASLDKVAQSGSDLLIQGWHASDAASGRPYRFLFIMNKATGKELKRIRVNNILRNDVASVYPNLYGASTSGFSINANVKEFAGKKVYFISRYAGESSGNLDYVDYSFSGQTFTIR